MLNLSTFVRLRSHCGEAADLKKATPVLDEPNSWTSMVL